MTIKSLIPFTRLAGREVADPFFSGFLLGRRDIDRVFEDFFKTGNAWKDAELAPRIDVKEVENGLEISAELPGVEEKDVEIELVDDMLTIKGEKKLEKTEDDKASGYHVQERVYGSFLRQVQLPFAADPAKVEAQFAKGILTVTCPRPEAAAEKARRIAIKSNGH